MSEDGGANFSRFADVQECWAIGFGKAEEGANYPAAYMYGKVYNEWGVYRSSDKGESWVKLVDYPLGLFDIVTAISGDPEIFGRVYIAYKGNSFVYGSIPGSEPEPETPLGVNDPLGTSFFPNPVLNELTITTPAHAKFTLYNSAGTPVLEFSFIPGRHVVDLSHLSEGLYILRETGKKQNNSYKLIIQ